MGCALIQRPGHGRLRKDGRVKPGGKAPKDGIRWIHSKNLASGRQRQDRAAFSAPDDRYTRAAHKDAATEEDSGHPRGRLPARKATDRGDAMRQDQTDTRAETTASASRARSPLGGWWISLVYGLVPSVLVLTPIDGRLGQVSTTSIAGVLVYLAFTLLLLRQSARNRIDEPIWFIVLLFVFAAAILLFGRGVAEWLGV